VRRRSALLARLVGGAMMAGALAGCASAPPRTEADFSAACTRLGLAPGTDAFADCVGQQRLQQQIELQRIRQAREATRGGTKL
jgi:hypothetical protein